MAPRNPFDPYDNDNIKDDLYNEIWKKVYEEKLDQRFKKNVTAYNLRSKRIDDYIENIEARKSNAQRTRSIRKAASSIDFENDENEWTTRVKKAKIALKPKQVKRKRRWNLSNKIGFIPIAITLWVGYNFFIADETKEDVTSTKQKSVISEPDSEINYQKSFNTLIDKAKEDFDKVTDNIKDKINKKTQEEKKVVIVQPDKQADKLLTEEQKYEKDKYGDKDDIW